MGLSLANYLTWLHSQTTGRVPPIGLGQFGTFSAAPPLSGREVPTSPGETGQGSSPETSDQSTGGRISLAAQLDDPNSLANVTLGLMGTLAGPLGTLAVSVGKAAMASHNQAALTQGLRGEQGPQLTSQRVSEAISQNNRGPAPDAPPDEAVPDVDITNSPDMGLVAGLTGGPGGPAGAAAAAAAAGQGGNTGVGTGEGPAGESGGVGGTAYHQGGVVRDRRPGMDEPITAQQGEFVVARGPAKKYRGLLEAINEGDVPEIKRQARTLKEALTR